MTVVVPRCGRVGCQEDRTDAKHVHDYLDAGDRVVVEPKRPTAPGYAWSSPAGTVTERLDNGARFRVQLEGEVQLRTVPADLITRWHTWRRRAGMSDPKAKLLPRLGRAHHIDPELGVVEPPLF